MSNNSDSNQSSTAEPPPKTVNLWLLAFAYIVLCVIIFFVTEAMYADEIINTILGHSSPAIGDFVKPDQTNKGSYVTIWNSVNTQLTYIRAITFLVLGVVLYFTNFGFIYKVYLGGSQDDLAFQILAICFASILGVIFLLCNNVEFIKIFENTIGYSIVGTFYTWFANSAPNLDAFMRKIFDDKMENKLGVHYDFLFTIFRLDNLGDVLQEIGVEATSSSSKESSENKYPFTIQNGIFQGFTQQDNDLRHLIRLVVKKHLIGHICWVFFGAFMTTVVAFKYLAKYT